MLWEGYGNGRKEGTDYWQNIGNINCKFNILDKYQVNNIIAGLNKITMWINILLMNITMNIM